MSHEYPRGRHVWFDLNTSVAEAAQAFYTALIGWGTESWDAGPEPYTMWTLDGIPIGGMVQMTEELQKAGVPPHWLAYIAVPDTDATVDRAVELGGTVAVPATDIPTVGRFAVLKDPQGAFVAAFHPENDPSGPDEMAKVGQFSWHELMTTDYEAAFAFYSDLFGWQKSEVMDMGEMGIYQMYGRTPEMPIGGMMNKPPEMPVSAWLYYIRVADLDASLAQLRELGGQLINGPMEVPGGDRVAQCMDPQGGAFALHATATAPS